MMKTKLTLKNLGIKFCNLKLRWKCDNGTVHQIYWDKQVLSS